MIEFQDYNDLTFDFISKMFKMKIQFEFSIKSFQNFPDNINYSVKRSWEKSIDFTLRERSAFLNDEKIEERSAEVLEGDRISTPYFRLHQLNKKQDHQFSDINGNITKVSKIDFKELILEQHLIYFVGLLEGFLIESVQIIYYNNPHLLNKHDLSLNFKEINELNDLNEIRKKMTEIAIGRTWSEGNFTSRFEKLRNKFDINLKFKKQLKSILDEANLIRNCILHNGSKVSSDYEDMFGLKRNVVKGDKIEFSAFFLDAVYYLSLDFIKELFIEVSNISWKNIDKTTAEDCIGHIHNHYYKDFILKPDHYLYKELKENNIL